MSPASTKVPLAGSNNSEEDKATFELTPSTPPVTSVVRSKSWSGATVTGS